MKSTIISNSLNKSLPLLKIVSKLSQKNRNNILKELGGEKTVYNAFHEIAHNTLKGNYKLSKPQLKKLKPHNNVLKKLCIKSNRNCCKKRKKLIVQSGGFLPILIPAIATILSSIISRNV